MLKSTPVTITSSIRGKKVVSATMYRGRVMRECPKSWRKIAVVGHNFGNLYNPGHIVVFVARDGSYRYEIYRDGSIFPFYGRIDIEFAQ